ncbi:MAG: tetratricopeptide repeat protein [Bacteroidales bacterium]|nr:tetratricopeptide repeat protein [Bacteroidales bacterium]
MLMFIIIFTWPTGIYGVGDDVPVDTTFLKLEDSLYYHPDSVLHELAWLEGKKNTFSGQQNFMFYFLKGECYLELNRPDSAVANYRIASNYLENAGKKIYHGKLYTGYALAYQLKGMHDSTLRYHTLAYKVGKSINNLKMISFAENEKGSAFLSLNKPDSALFHYKVALEAKKEQGDSTKIASVLNNISLAYYKMGIYEKAIEAQLQSMKIKEKLDTRKDRSYASSLLNIGSLYLKLKKYDKSGEFLTRAYQYSHDHQLDRLSGHAALNLGINYKNSDKLDSAVYYYNKAIAIYDELGLKSSTGRAYANLGLLHKERKEYGKSLDYLNKAIAISRAAGNNYATSMRSSHIAEIHMLENRLQEARPHIFKALGLAKGVNSPELDMNVYSILSDFYARTGDYKKSLTYFKRYKDVQDSLFSAESQEKINELQTKYETEKKEQTIAQLKNQQKIKELEISKQQAAIRQQRIMIILTVVIFALFLIAGYLLFNRFKLKQKNLQDKLARQKVEIEQRLLRSQMNPHFIFNSLVSVQSYIRNNEPEKAQEYLSNFSNLMRLILENSRKSFVPLSDEIKLLELYIELEKLRFSKKIEHHIHHNVDEPDFIGIPPMMIQPFVENSIKHAFKDTEKDGLLEVNFLLNNGLMKCEISDNGVGREKAFQDKQRETTGHHSLGVQVISERIELLRNEWNKKISLAYEDLKDDDGNPSGTKVNLLLPYTETDLE